MEQDNNTNGDMRYGQKAIEENTEMNAWEQ